METEPLYCAEQIVVPADLPAALKAFTKEVLRQRPASVAAFAARYFADLAARSAALDGVAPPSASQLRTAWAALARGSGGGGGGNAGAATGVSLERVTSACAEAGIEAATVDAVVKAARLDPSRLDAREVLLLLLALGSTGGYASALRGLFDVFGGTAAPGCAPRLPADELARLVRLLAARDADDELRAVVQALPAALEGRADVTLADLPQLLPGGVGAKLRELVGGGGARQRDMCERVFGAVCFFVFAKKKKEERNGAGVRTSRCCCRMPAVTSRCRRGKKTTTPLICRAQLTCRCLLQPTPWCCC